MAPGCTPAGFNSHELKNSAFSFKSAEIRTQQEGKLSLGGHKCWGGGDREALMQWEGNGGWGGTGRLSAPGILAQGPGEEAGEGGSSTPTAATPRSGGLTPCGCFSGEAPDQETEAPPPTAPRGP